MKLPSFVSRVFTWVRREPVVTSGIAGAITLNVLASVFHVGTVGVQAASDALLALGIPVIRSLVAPTPPAAKK